MNDTHCENCPFLAQGFKDCPNSIETLWHEQGSLQPKIVRDCAPRRTLLMLQELYNRVFALQQQINQQENQIFKQNGQFQNLLNALSYIEEQKELESTARYKMINHISSMMEEK